MKNIGLIIVGLEEKKYVNTVHYVAYQLWRGPRMPGKSFFLTCHISMNNCLPLIGVAASNTYKSGVPPALRACLGKLRPPPLRSILQNQGKITRLTGLTPYDALISKLIATTI